MKVMWGTKIVDMTEEEYHRYMYYGECPPSIIWEYMMRFDINEK